MSPLKPSMNVAARMGRWSARHRKIAIFGWLAFVVLAFAIGGKVGTKTIKASDATVGESHRAAAILDKAFPEADPLTEIVLIQGKSLKVTDPAFRAAVDDVVRTVSSFKSVKDVASPLSPDHTDLVSADGHTALVQWEMKGTDKQAEKRIDPITTATAAVADRHPSLYVGEAGAVSSNKALNAEFNKQLTQAGERSIPLTLIVLVLVFGALLAAFVPLLLALSAVLGTIGLLAIPNEK